MLLRSTFYQWYKRYLNDGYDGLADQPYRRTSAWNQLPPTEKSRIVELALEQPDLSSRDLACYSVDKQGCGAARAVCVGVHGVSYPEKSGLSHYTSLPINGSCRSLLYPTTAPNQLWQTDFTAPAARLFQDQELGLVLSFNRAE